VRRNLDVLREWASRPPGGRPRRVHLRFWLRPAAILAAPDGTVSALQVEQTAPDDGGSAVGTGRLSTIDAQLVLRSVGYRGLPIPGLPFDERTGTVPNDAGRVVRDGAPVSGLYVAGWSKRGPTGVIGTNKHDARETVASLLEDAPLLPRAPRRDPDDIVRLFAERDVRPVDWEGWRAIERAEAILGRQRGNDRVRITERAALLRAAHGE
jgi:ferredoxin--NADP+ reductase